MKQTFFHIREFNKKKLYMYFFLNMLVVALLIFTSTFKIKEGIGFTVLVGALVFLLLICMYLLIEFIILIPTSPASIKNICIGSILLLTLILMTYASLYLHVYRAKGKKAFVFTGESLSVNDFLYYSITTFTTTGYGDITSIGIISNILAASEMLMGFITSTILMAILTAKLIKKLGN
ncbi:two pore domain potassium channel family protein [Priestia megaterium]|nr:two pore domain potassium channel family protein [Priestia megaterium]